MKQWEVSKGPHNNKGNLSAFVMRNFAPGPKFSPLAAAVILITLAVWPIGHAKAETIQMADNQKEKNLNEDSNQRTMRSLMTKDANFQDRASKRNPDKPVYYKKWDRDLGDGDFQYSSQLEQAPDGLGFDTYESDGYGYDDDEYDHFNYKRFDSDKNKLNQNDKISKDSDLIQKSPILNDGKVENPPMEATTIELLNFQAKNLNPVGEISQSAKEESTVKALSLNKPMFPGTELPDSLADEKLKKKIADEQKANDIKPTGSEGNDKNSGNVRKVSEVKDNLEKSDKSQNLETVSSSHMTIKNMKVNDAKGNAANFNDEKNSKFNDLARDEGKIGDSDVKNSETKLKSDEKQEKNVVKIKEDKEMDSMIAEAKEVENVKDEARGKDVPHFVDNPTGLTGSEYKDGFDNMNTAGITDDEKASEDLKENEMNLAGLRDNRNELPYKYRDPMDRFRTSNYVKKDASNEYLRRKIGSRSSLEPASNWDTIHSSSKDNARAKNSPERSPKEPFHLDFPLADLENTDYHRNFIKSLKRYKGLDESSRILSQGDTPSPFTDNSKQQLASRVIEEEQRKRRSRLRRLKTSPVFAPNMRKRDRDRLDRFYGYGSETNYGRPYRPEDGIYGTGMEGYNEMNYNSYPGLDNRRESEFSDDETEIVDALGDEDTVDEDEGVTNNVKNKRQDSSALYGSEWDSDGELDDEEAKPSLVETENERLVPLPEKNANKIVWPGNEFVENIQKKKYKDFGLWQEPSCYPNTPLVLLQRSDNGEQSMKTFTNGRFKNEDGIDSEDLARLLSRDSNYVVLKKVPTKDQAQKISDSDRGEDRGKTRSALDNKSKKEKYKFSQFNLFVKAQNPGGEEDAEARKIFRSYKECYGNELLKKKEDRAKDLGDFFKDNDKEKELEENKEILVRIEDHFNQLQRGEPDKRLVYKPPITQAYRHIKEFENAEPVNETEVSQAQGYSEKKIEDSNNPNQMYMSPEKLLRLFKKDGKEVILLNKPSNSFLYKPKNQDTIESGLIPHVIPIGNIATDAVPNSNMVMLNNNPLPSAAMYACNVAPISNLPQNVNLLNPGNVLPNSNSMTNNYMVPNPLPPSAAVQNELMPNNVMQIKLPEVSQKSSDNNRKYYLYGPESDAVNAPKHEVRILQSDFNPSQDSSSPSGKTLTPQQSTYSLENYNKPNQNAQKNTQTNKAQPFDKNGNFSPQQQVLDLSTHSEMQHQNPYYYGNRELKCMANTYQTGAAERRFSAVISNLKKISKKDNQNDYLSGDLKRFMRDFQNLDQGYQSNQNLYQTKDMSGMSLQELTSHGGKHLQKLNTLLKDIINNKVQVNDAAARKNVKRGMFEYYKDHKNWQPGADSTTDPQVRSGKWTSVVYDGPNRMGFFNTNNIASQVNVKGTPDEGNVINDSGTFQNTYSRRKKRESPYDSSKASTKNLEVKVKSVPYAVEMQPLNTGSISNSNTNSNNNNNNNNNNINNQQQKSSSRASLTLPPDKLMNLLNFIELDDEGKIELEEDLVVKDDLCRRQPPFLEDPHPPPFRRKLMSTNEEPQNAADREDSRMENLKKSLVGYLDPLIQRIAEYENKSRGRSKRGVHTKREIELDESMPNDFQNFLVTSLGGFSNQKREIVKKDEALWEKDGTRDDSNQIVDGTDNREPNEESTLGKRDTSENAKQKQKNEKELKVAPKENEATNIRIRIVDGNANGELLAKASEKSGTNQLTSKSRIKTEKNGLVAGPEENPNVHEVYLIADTDSKRRKKNKLAIPRSDQTPQKQPISSHLPQTETVYNPSPGGNKAQMNINDAQTKMKYLDKTSNIYNGTASMMEDNIIRNNLRNGNINTFTYQRREEPTPYPLRSLTNPPSSGEFEMLDSRNPSRSKPFGPRQMAANNLFAASSFTNNNPEIIYKDEATFQYLNNAKTLNSKHGYSSRVIPHLRSYNDAMKGRPYMKGPENPNPEPFQRDYAEEYAEYSDPEETGSFSDGSLNRRADAKYGLIAGRERDSGILSREIKQDRIYERSQENLNPKMIEMWNNYAKTHLTPESHKEAMNREFEEAYFRRNRGGQNSFKSEIRGNLESEKCNAEIPSQPDYGRLAKESNQNQEKIGKRLTKVKRSGPVQIGQRFFYTFKTEIPDAEYYNLITEPVRFESLADSGREYLNGIRQDEKKYEGSTTGNSRPSEKIKQKATDNVKRGAEALDWSYIVHETESNEKIGEGEHGARRKRFMEVHQPGNDLGGNRVKRFEDSTKSADESKVMEKRFSPGHLTESHFRKYHRKNFNGKRATERDEIKENEFDSCPRAKRDAIADSVKEDMLKRMQEEKKAKSMIKNLKVELAVDDVVPLAGQRQATAEEPVLQQTHQRLQENENRKNQIMEEEQSKLAEQQHRNGAKSGSPDLYKTFEIKRGRRRENEMEEKIFHNIVSRSEPDMYIDTVFVKGAKGHKVRKFTDEGFEPLTPDLRFSDKSSLNLYMEREDKSAARESPNVEERAGSSTIVNRKVEDKSKIKDAGSEPKQKMTHGFSHEAPLLGPANPLSSPQIFESLKAESRYELKTPKHRNEGTLAGASLGKSGNLQKGNRAFKTMKLTDESKKTDPLVGAVLVLAKRDKTRKRHAQSEFSSELRNFRDNRPSGNGYGGDYNLEKRNIEDREYSENSELAPEIVNDVSGCRSCGSESQTKSCNNKQTNTFKQSPFSFSQLPNMKTGKDGNEKRGEDIVESILGRVESNPHFRKVIGPGLKWRGRKCYSEGDIREQSNYSSSNKSNFVRQVRKILVKFVKDIEKLAAQDLGRGACSKLDGGSNKFLHELLEVPYQPKSEGMQNNFQLDSYMRYGNNDDQSGTCNSSIGDGAYMDVASIEAMSNRRRIVLKLLGEYQKLSDCEKKKVEVLGQYLMHELEVLNNALNGKNQENPECSSSNTVLPAKCEEMTTSQPILSTERVTGNVTCPAKCVQSTEKDKKRGSVKLPFIWSNPDDLKLLKTGHSAGADCPSSISNFQVPNSKDPIPFSIPPSKYSAVPTEMTGISDRKMSLPNSNIKFPFKNCDDLSLRDGNSKKDGCQPDGDIGRLDKLGYGDAAGLQLSLKTHCPWYSNLDLGKDKTLGIFDQPKSLLNRPYEPNNPVTEFPYNGEILESSADVPQLSPKKDALSEDDPDNVYDVDYQDYEEDDNYKGLKTGNVANLLDTKTFLSLDSR